MARLRRNASVRATARACLLAFSGLLGACGPRYDVVIAGGRVMDPESGLDAIRNVGILDGKVALLTEEALDGRRVIDATGLVVAPGFVDLHRHGQTEQAYRLQVHDGVTTGLELELGAAQVEEWYAERARGQVVNYGVSVGHIGVRAVAMGDPNTGLGGRSARQRASPQQITETERLLRVGLAEGAIGVGLGPAYTPGATDAEIARMLDVVAQRGVVAFVHIRGGLMGLDRTIASAREAGAALHVVHANSSAGEAIAPFLARIERARDTGQDVSTEMYPYAASQTTIQSALFDGWESWGDERFARYEWAGTGERLTRASFADFRRRGGSLIIHGRTEDLTRIAVESPLTMIASDGGLSHPRGAGTFARVLGRHVREEGTLDLMDALARMTIRPAQRLESFVPAMRAKGRLSVGADADVTVFDPAAIIDRATYADPRRPSEGIAYVLVNGVVVVDGGELVPDVRPGRAVRGVASY
jgi:N-acyl-D-aspartate/D-glutamate deacylase